MTMKMDQRGTLRIVEVRDEGAQPVQLAPAAVPET